MDLQELERFVVAAKQATYVGSGKPVPSCRPASHDLGHASGQWRYLDSYFGGADFIGQEVVWFGNSPVWAMNYYGAILREDLIDAAAAGETIKAALSALYAEGRFLGGWQWQGPHGLYEDRSNGDVTRFSGAEWIAWDGVVSYRLDYHGGLIRD